MAILIHEIWIEDSASGPLPTLCLAGPDGESIRTRLKPGAKRVHTFEADSNYEAMTIYYGFNGWGEYKVNEPLDRRPYPDSWAARQNPA